MGQIGWHPAVIVRRYALIALLATAVNLLVQMMWVAWYTGPEAVGLSVLAGTAAGLPLKYVAEKRWIFAYRARDLAHDGRLFVFYSLLGVLTTLIFWGIEAAFHWWFQTHAMRYLGGAIGLTLGYFIKYQLDKRYVFVDWPKEQPA